MESISLQEDDTLLKCLIDLAENTPKYLRTQMEGVFDICMKVQFLHPLLEHTMTFQFTICGNIRGSAVGLWHGQYMLLISM